MSIKLNQTEYIQLNNESATAGTNTLSTEKLLPGNIIKTISIGIINKTSSYDRLRIGILEGETLMVFAEEQNPRKAEFYTDNIRLIYREGQRLQFELTGCTSGDKIEAFLTINRESEQ